jgi:hypothetical protein
MAIHYSSFSAGTPGQKETRLGAVSQPTALAPRSFVSRLSQRLLSHPQGGLLAVLGQVDQAWGYSFRWPGAEGPLAGFRSLILSLTSGYPIGAATEFLRSGYAASATDLSSKSLDVNYGAVVDETEQGRLWAFTNDLRSFVILGDPATRLSAAAALS